MVKKFIVNLDLEPEIRWKHVVEGMKNEIEEFKPNIIKIIDEMLGSLKYMIIPIISIYCFFSNNEYIRELKSISKYTNISLEYLMIIQLCYESASCCSSIITNVDTKPYFFRTMDWPMDILKNITIDLEFVKNGSTLYYATSWVGYLGIFTATIPNQYSLSINFKSNLETTELGAKSMQKNISRIIKKYWPIGFMIRHICDNKFTELELIDYCKNEETVCPYYLNICNSLGNKYTFMKNTILYENNQYYKLHFDEYITQTNCDYNMDKPNILYSVERMKYATEIITQHNNNFNSIEELKSLFEKFPIVNEETIYISIMSPRTNIHYSYII